MSRISSCLSFTLAVFILASTTSCGSQNPFADALLVTVSPSSSLLIGPGPASSCADMVSYKVALQGASAGTAPILTQSVAGPVVVINTFSLQWNSTDTLYVQEIRIRVTGAQISGGVTSQILGLDEVADLLATPLAIINPPQSQSPTNAAPVNPVIIVSTDRARAAPPSQSVPISLFAQCGLVFGGITLNSSGIPPVTPQFTANIIISVIGTAQDQSGNNQRFVEFDVNASATYYGS